MFKAICVLGLCLHAMDALGQSNGSPLIESPALAKLATSIEHGDGSALEAFWQESVIRGAPLIEEIPNRPVDALFTFLWRAKTADPQFVVRFTSSFTQRNPGGLDRLKHLPNSDVWYGSYALPKRATVGYAFIVPISVGSSAPLIGEAEYGGVKYGQYRDPFNLRTTDEIGATISFVLGPQANPSPFIDPRPDVAKGRLETIEVESQSLAGRRRIDMYLPAGYRAGATPYRFVLMFDGDQYTSTIPTPTILDNMIATGKVPPVVVAFMHSPNRDKDLLPNEAFQSFIAKELLPALRAKYRISVKARESVVAGFSLGGLAAVYTAYKNPSLFGNAITQSGSLWWSADFWDAPDYVQGEFLNSNSGGLIKLFSEQSRLPIRFHVNVGVWEQAGGLLPNRLFGSVLKGKAYELMYREYLGAHDATSWKQTLPDALQFSLSD